MLGYRTFVNVAGDPDEVLHRLDEQIYSWARSKRWNADALVDGETVELGPGVAGTLVRLSAQDGSRTTRLETVEASGWTVRLTAHVPGGRDRPPWLWADVESPDGAWVAPPNLVRGLFDVLSVRDGGQELAVGTVRAGEDDVDALVARVLDPDRRTIAFVAGSTEDIPLAPWAAHVTKLTRECSGLASTTVLDPAATRAFNEAVGADLAVQPWTVRTFMPRVVLGSQTDALRHRYLTMQRIIDDPAARIARMLGSRATSVIKELPLPRDAIRIDRAVAKHLDEAVIGRITEVSPEVTAAITEAAEQALIESGSAATPDAEPSLVPLLRPHVASVLASAVAELVGAVELDVTAAERLVELAARGRQASDQQTAIRARMDQLRAEVDDLSSQLRTSNELLEEERLEHQLTDLDRARADDLVRRLRNRLVSEGADSWVGPPAHDDDLAPRDFAELLVRINGLTALVFTGDQGIVMGLDAQDTGRWAVKAWDALCALEDYAAASRDGRCSGDVETYLKDTPSGCRGYSANRHARDEGEDVRNNPRYRRPRELPVPIEVEPTGLVFMGAHFKIAQFGMTSPRLHYHDDTARSGRIYVGYIGPHLPTKQSN